MSDTPNQIEFQYKCEGKHGRIKVWVKWPDGSYTDKIDVLNDLSRKRFVTRLMGRHAGLPIDEVTAQLDKIAEKIASEAMSDEEGSESAGDSDDEILIQIGRDAEKVELFHSGARHDAEPFARIVVEDHHEVWNIRSRAFATWLRQQFYERMQRSPVAQSFADAINTLASNALFEGDSIPVFLRIAPWGEAIVLDLGEETWAAVLITATGWRVVPSSEVPVRFTRRRGMLALPVPVTGGSVRELKPFVNIDDGDMWVLYVCSVVSLFRPRGPYAVLTFSGEHGSAKSTAAKKTRALVDPNSTPVRRLTRDDRDLMIAATNSYVVAFDNLSSIPPSVSDALCSLATGGGFSTRQLYTDNEEMLFDAMRPVILNGIEDVATRPDLLDRCVIFALKPISEEQRKEERTLDAAFDQAKPRILGAFLDGVSTALRRSESIVIKRKPRMADFARWCAAAETSFGFPEGSFVEAYMRNRGDAVTIALESSPIAVAVQAFIRRQEQWEGTSTELLNALEEGYADQKTQKRKDWPHNGKGMAEALKRIAPALRTIGIEVEQGERKRGRARDRLVSLRLVSDPQPASDDADDKDGADGVVPTFGCAISADRPPEQDTSTEIPHENVGTRSSAPSEPSAEPDPSLMSDAAAHEAAMDPGDGEDGRLRAGRAEELFDGGDTWEDPA